MDELFVFSDKLASVLRPMPTTQLESILETARIAGSESDDIRRQALDFGHEAAIWRVYGLKDSDPKRYVAMLNLLSAIHLYPHKFNSLKEKVSGNY